MIKEILDGYVKKTGKVWKHDRSKTVGASEIGQCSRRVWYIKNSHPHDAGYVDDWGARVRGTAYEDSFWQPAMHSKFGAKLLYSGKAQRTFVDGKLSATPDGLIVDVKPDILKHLGVKNMESDCLVVECKTIDPRATLDKAKPHHVFQAQVQMYMIRTHTKYKPNHALLTYTNAAMWSDVHEFVVEYDPQVVDAAMQRAEKILTSTLAHGLQPEGWTAGGSECRHCPFAKACGIERRNLPFADKACDPQFAAEMEDMVRDLRKVETVAASSSYSVRAQTQAIKDRLREKGIRKVPGVLTWSIVKGAKRYDNSAIQTAAIEGGIDIEKFTLLGEASDRLTLDRT